MSTFDVIREWKDEEYRFGLTAEDRMGVPDHPAGMMELTDSDLDDAAGGQKPDFPPTYETYCVPDPFGRVA